MQGKAPVSLGSSADEPPADVSIVLADADGVSTLATALGSRPSLIDLFEATALAESIVLNDRLFAVRPHETELSETRRESPDALLQAWVEEGALEYVTLPPEPSVRKPAKAAKPARQVSNLAEGELTQARSVDYDALFGGLLGEGLSEAARLIRAERYFRRPAVALPRQKPFYETTAHVMQDHAVCNLAAKYDDLAKALKQLRASYNQRRRYYTLPIPPIALLIFKAAKTPPDIIRATLELRGRYQPLRQELRELRIMLDDSSIDLVEKRRAEDQWMRRWATLKDLHFKGRPDAFQIANTSSGLINSGQLLHQFQFTDLVNVPKVIGALLDVGKDAWYRWKVRVLHTTANRYLRAPDKEIRDEVARVADRKIENEEMEQAAFVAEALEMMQGKVMVQHIE